MIRKELEDWIKNQKIGEIVLMPIVEDLNYHDTCVVLEELGRDFKKEPNFFLSGGECLLEFISIG